MKNELDLKALVGHWAIFYKRKTTKHRRCYIEFFIQKVFPSNEFVRIKCIDGSLRVYPCDEFLQEYEFKEDLGEVKK